MVCTHTHTLSPLLTGSSPSHLTVCIRDLGLKCDGFTHTHTLSPLLTGSSPSHLSVCIRDLGLKCDGLTFTRRFFSPYTHHTLTIRLQLTIHSAYDCSSPCTHYTSVAHHTLTSRTFLQLFWLAHLSHICWCVIRDWGKEHDGQRVLGFGLLLSACLQRSNFIPQVHLGFCTIHSPYTHHTPSAHHTLTIRLQLTIHSPYDCSSAYTHHTSAAHHTLTSHTFSQLFWLAHLSHICWCVIRDWGKEHDGQRVLGFGLLLSACLQRSNSIPQVHLGFRMLCIGDTLSHGQITLALVVCDLRCVCQFQVCVKALGGCAGRGQHAGRVCVLCACIVGCSLSVCVYPVLWCVCMHATSAFRCPCGVGHLDLVPGVLIDDREQYVQSGRLHPRSCFGWRTQCSHLSLLRLRDLLLGSASRVAAARHFPPCHAPAAQIRARTPHTAHAGGLSGATRFDVCAVGTATTHGDLPQARHPTVVAVVRLVQGIRQSVESPNVALDKQPRSAGPPVDTGR